MNDRLKYIGYPVPNNGSPFPLTVGRELTRLRRAMRALAKAKDRPPARASEHNSYPRYSARCNQRTQLGACAAAAHQDGRPSGFLSDDLAGHENLI